MVLIQKEAVKRYQELCARGICAHAALVHAVNWLFMSAKEEGFTLGETMGAARRLRDDIQHSWEEV